MVRRLRELLRRLKKFEVYPLVRHSIVYGVGDVIQRFLSIFLLPIYTRYLNPGDYGVISLLAVLNLIVGSITLCGLNNGISRYFYYTDQERMTISEVVWSPFSFVAILTLLVITPLGMFSGNVSRVLFDSEEFSYLVTLTLIGVLISNLSGISRSILIFQERSMTVNYLNVSSVAVGAGLGLFFVVYLRRGVAGAIEANVVGSAIMAVAGFLLGISRFKFAFSCSVLKKQLSFSLPLVAAVFAFLFIDSSDRYLLKVFLPLSEVGLYNVGYNIGLIMMLVVGGFTLSWPPYYHKNNQNDEGQSVCNSVLKSYLLVTSVFVVVLSLVAPHAVRMLTTKNFHEAYTVVPWVAMAYMLKGPYVIFLIGVLIRRKTSWQLYLEGCAAIVNIGLNILLIPRIGREAAAITTLIAYAIMVVGAYFMVMRINPIPNLSLGYAIRVVLLTLLVSASSLWIVNMSARVLLACSLLVLFGGVLIIMNYREIGALLKGKVKYA